MDQRAAFIAAWRRQEVDFSTLCREFSICRKTGYKWIKRVFEGGLSALSDKSRRPHRIAHAVSAEVEQAVIAVRKRFPLWGPLKLRAWLVEKEPKQKWPAASTIGLLLKRQGLVTEKRRRIRTPVRTQPLSAATEPNVLWATDFKGCFQVAGRYCHPLTISDGFSRYLLCVEALGSERFELVQPVFERVFREYGMPWRIRTDNGSPFSSPMACGGLSKLAIWWVKLGITPERIVPGHPEQNGQHERMHRTLKAHTVQPRMPSTELQQAAFSAFQREYNQERPHQALGMKTPASVYAPSRRPFPDDVGDPEYPSEFVVRRLYVNGMLGWACTSVHIGHVLGSEAVGLEAIADDVWQVWFGPIYLGLLRLEARRKLTFLRNLPDQPQPSSAG